MSNISKNCEKITATPQPTVAILLSTYNGSQHISDQIKSIIHQMNNNDRIYIRDDKSTDNTLKEIEKINDSRILILPSFENLGFGRSFMTLIAHVPQTFDFYFFADQDDVWIQGKISRAIQKINFTPRPSMVCTRLNIVDNSLNQIGMSPNYKMQPSFRNAICQNIATGCTIAINKAAITLLKKIPLDTYKDGLLYYHDWWIYLNVSYFGNVFFDENPSIHYRQHSNNQIGMASGIRRYTSMAKTILKRPWSPILLRQLNLFYKIHQKNSSTEELQDIYPLCHGSGRSMIFAFIRSSLPTWQRPTDAILFRLVLIFELITGKIPTLK